MTIDEQVSALAYLNLAALQARFLIGVARHGGYCIRRQYAAFAGVQYNGEGFLDRLVQGGRMVWLPFPHGSGGVYHLTSPRIYRAIGLEPPRWAPRSMAAMARKVMLLDVVIAHPDRKWLIQESDQVALFTGRFGVSLADLPQRTVQPFGRVPRTGLRRAPTTQYFPYRWPVAVVGEGGAERVHLVALIVRAPGRRFTQFLLDHSRLLACLPAWTVIAVVPPRSVGPAACRAAFYRVVHSDRAPSPGRSRHRSLTGRHANDEAELENYFQIRHALESGAAAAVSAADIDRYREARTRLIGPLVEARYEAWRVRTSVATRLDGKVKNRALAHVKLDPSRAEFQTFQLPSSYPGFGALPGTL
jgi:hypothetical protein